VRAVTRIALVRQRNSIHQLVTVHSPVIAAAAAILLAASPSLYAMAGGGFSPKWDLPYGWIIGALAFIALTPERPQGRHLVTLTRSLLWSVPLVVCVWMISTGWPFLWGSDVVFVSAVLTLVIGLELTTLTPMKLRGALQRLLDREVLQEPAKVRDRLENDLERIGDRYSLIGGWVVAAPFLIAFLFVLTLGILSDPSDSVRLILDFITTFSLPFIAGFVVGRRVGRMVVMRV
jgi:hypothetical protein